MSTRKTSTTKGSPAKKTPTTTVNAKTSKASRPPGKQGSTSPKKPPETRSASKPHGIVRVLGREVYVRSGPRSWVIGTLFGEKNDHPNVKHKDSFDAQHGEIKGYVWGRALGNANRCGYVEREFLKEMNSPSKDDCGHPPNSREENRAYLCKGFASMTNADDNAGSPVKTKRRTTLYANFDKDRPLDPVFDIPEKRNVGWRWVTKGSHDGHRYVMVNFVVAKKDEHSYYKEGTSLWGFVKLSDLENLPDIRPC